ncbi:hypothetical protein D1AOALGA4SA_9339 [Olavius algarvensis Delta 1 endosymbiont]|nr:hypothetical protein D1AOALGA4SA_9339 [Olavius algarvensis Delta 1 endosymbiont]
MGDSEKTEFLAITSLFFSIHLHSCQTFSRKGVQVAEQKVIYL